MPWFSSRTSSTASHQLRAASDRCSCASCGKVCLGTARSDARTHGCRAIACTSLWRSTRTIAKSGTTTSRRGSTRTCARASLPSRTHSHLTALAHTCARARTLVRADTRAPAFVCTYSLEHVRLLACALTHAHSRAARAHSRTLACKHARTHKSEPLLYQRTYTRARTRHAARKSKTCRTRKASSCAAPASSPSEGSAVN
mmetsp:Transcript_36276/g.76332  ORF Transcript_36276/g.76332 Transcript_36276/m.76332 type:complete len:200 (-) Transcript_36276:168-767(-)